MRMSSYRAQRRDILCSLVLLRPPATPSPFAATHAVIQLHLVHHEKPRLECHEFFGSPLHLRLRKSESLQQIFRDDGQEYGLVALCADATYYDAPDSLGFYAT